MSLSAVISELCPSTVVESAAFGEFRFPGQTDLAVSFGDRLVLYTVRSDPSLR